MMNDHTPNTTSTTDEEKNKYDFSNLSFEALFNVPVFEMYYRGERLPGGINFFDLDFLALHKIPVILSPEEESEFVETGDFDDVNDEAYDFLALSFEDLLKIPFRTNRWQEGDSEPDLDNLSLSELMNLPVRRTFPEDMDADALKKLLGGADLFSSVSTDGNPGSGGSGFTLWDYGDTDLLATTFTPKPISPPSTRPNEYVFTTFDGSIPLLPPLPTGPTDDACGCPNPNFNVLQATQHGDLLPASSLDASLKAMPDNIRIEHHGIPSNVNLLSNDVLPPEGAHITYFYYTDPDDNYDDNYDDPTDNLLHTYCLSEAKDEVSFTTTLGTQVTINRNGGFTYDPNDDHIPYYEQFFYIVSNADCSLTDRGLIYALQDS